MPIMHQRIIHNRFFSALIFLLVIHIFSQCVKEEATLNNPQVKLDPGIALPTVHARYSLNSIFNPEDTLEILQPNEDGILTVSYNQKVFSDSASSFINFDDVDISGSLPLEPKNEKLEITFKKILEFNFNNFQAPVGLEDVKLYEIKFDRANFRLSDNASSPITPVSIAILFPSINDPISGDTLSIDYIVGSGLPSDNPMDGYVASFVNNDTITSGFEVWFTLDLGIITEPFELEYEFTLVNYEYLKGYFGNFLYDDLNDIQLNIDFLSEVDEIEIEFDTATFSIDYLNSFGINADIFMDGLSITSNDGSEITTGFFPTQDDPFPLVAPAINDYPFDTTVVFDINEVLDLLSENPRQITFQPMAEFNPNGQVDTNYIKSGSQFSLDVGLYIPLKFWASVIAYKDKFAFDGSSLNNITQLEYLGLLLISSNVLPLDAKIEVTFTSGDQTIYSVGGDEGFQIVSDLDADGVPVAGEPFEQLLDIEKDQFENLKQCDSLMLRIALNTVAADEGGPGNRTYQAFKQDFDYYIDVSLKLIAEGEFILSAE